MAAEVMAPPPPLQLGMNRGRASAPALGGGRLPPLAAGQSRNKRAPAGGPTQANGAGHRPQSSSGGAGAAAASLPAIDTPVGLGASRHRLSKSTSSLRNKPIQVRAPLRTQPDPLSFEDLYAIAFKRASLKFDDLRRKGEAMVGGRMLGGSQSSSQPSLRSIQPLGTKSKSLAISLKQGGPGSDVAQAKVAFQTPFLQEEKPAEDLPDPAGDWAKGALSSIPTDTVEATGEATPTTGKTASNAVGAPAAPTTPASGRRPATLSSGTKAKAKDEETDLQQNARLVTAFNRYRSPGSAEVSVHVLGDVLGHLGFMRTADNAIERIVAEITKYAELELFEFIEFVHKWAEYEQEVFMKMFMKYDEDNSGRLSRDEVCHMVIEMGITPMRDSIDEMFELADTGEDGEIDFDGFMHLMGRLRSTEGFTKAEIDDFRRVFSRFAESVGGDEQQPEMRAEILGDALKHAFGPQAKDVADKITEILEVDPDTPSHVDAQIYGGRLSTAGSGGSQATPRGNAGVQFREFLAWARSMREAELEEYKQQFATFDRDKSGSISPDELYELLTALGFLPVRSVVEEMIQEVDTKGERELSFEQFVTLMSTFRSNDGFGRDELLELEQAFNKFGKGEPDMSCKELTPLLRDNGFVFQLEYVGSMIGEVDYDGSGRLDFREFLRLMRLLRDQKLQHMQEIFTVKCDERTQRMPKKALITSLSALGYSDEVVEKAMAAPQVAKSSHLIDFDTFVEIDSVAKHACVASWRLNAGFLDKEMHALKAQFEMYDSDGGGTIESTELLPLLADLGIPLSSLQDQTRMLEMFDAARRRAREAGVPDSDLGQSGGAALSFYVFVHLTRSLLEAQEENRASESEAKFSVNEIAELKEIFDTWSKDSAEPRKRPSSAGASAGLSTLSSGGLRRILKSIGVRMTSEQQEVLAQKMKEVGAEDNGGFIYFSDFLTLMRWMLDTNFANIQGKAEEASKRPSTPGPETPGSSRAPSPERSPTSSPAAQTPASKGKRNRLEVPTPSP